MWSDTNYKNSDMEKLISKVHKEMEEEAPDPIDHQGTKWNERIRKY